MKKAARDAIRAKLMEEQSVIRAKLYSNKRAMVRLVEEQTRLKRERGIYTSLIRSLGDSA